MIVGSSLSVSKEYENLIVVGTVGETTPTASVYNRIDTSKISVNPDAVSRVLELARENLSSEIYFPLEPKKLVPGLMKSYQFNNKARIRPFAIVGVDELSLKWLKMREEKLAELHTSVFVVQAESFDDISKLKAMFPSLNFAASNEGNLDTQLKVSSYPFLVTETGVFQ